MSRRAIAWIVLAVIALHVLLFLWLGDVQPVPKVRQAPRPNFTAEEVVFENPRTGERTTFREITVSTKLADPSKLPLRPGERAEARNQTPEPGGQKPEDSGQRTEDGGRAAEVQRE